MAQFDEFIRQFRHSLIQWIEYNPKWFTFHFGTSFDDVCSSLFGYSNKYQIDDGPFDDVLYAQKSELIKRKNGITTTEEY